MVDFAPESQARHVTVRRAVTKRAGELPKYLKIEDMLVYLSSWCEQPVPHKRPNKSVCQKKRYCQREQELIDGDIHFVPCDVLSDVSCDAMFGFCARLFEA